MIKSKKQQPASLFADTETKPSSTIMTKEELYAQTRVYDVLPAKPDKEPETPKKPAIAPKIKERNDYGAMPEEQRVKLFPKKPMTLRQLKAMKKG